MPKECDWGRPCNCMECTPKPKGLCEVCCKEKGVFVESTLRKDRKGCKYYEFTVCCSSCYATEYGVQKEAFFNLLVEAVKENCSNQLRKHEVESYSNKQEVRSALLRMFEREVNNRISKRLVFLMLGGLNTEIYWKVNNEQMEYKSGELQSEGTDAASWFQHYILDDVLMKITKYPISDLKMKLFPTYKGFKIHYDTPGEARRREWCRRNL